MTAPIGNGDQTNGSAFYEEEEAEPPAVIDSWTFPMKGMFPAPRPFAGGKK